MNFERIITLGEDAEYQIAGGLDMSKADEDSNTTIGKEMASQRFWTPILRLPAQRLPVTSFR